MSSPSEQALGSGAHHVPDDDWHQRRYELALRADEEQKASIDAAQARAGLLLAALAITATEIGGRAVDRPGNPLPGAQVIALGALVLCGAALLIAIWPRRYVGTVKPEFMPRKATTHAVQDLTLRLGTTVQDNERSVGRVWLALKVAIAAMVVNTMAWVSILIFR